jgi:hypothetical protein
MGLKRERSASSDKDSRETRHQPRGKKEALREGNASFVLASSTNKKLCEHFQDPDSNMHL